MVVSEQFLCNTLRAIGGSPFSSEFDHYCIDDNEMYLFVIIMYTKLEIMSVPT